MKEISMMRSMNRVLCLGGLTLLLAGCASQSKFNETSNTVPGPGSSQADSSKENKVARMGDLKAPGVPGSTPKEWDAFMDDFNQTLDEFKVPAAEQAELKAIVQSTYGDIVVGQS